MLKKKLVTAVMNGKEVGEVTNYRDTDRPDNNYH